MKVKNFERQTLAIRQKIGLKNARALVRVRKEQMVNGAQILVNALRDEGVNIVFGYPGASILSVYDALVGSSLRHILTASESGACFAAEGYARASHKAGVVLATSGPGATNLVTGIADAFMDSVPLVAITGNVPLSELGHDAFQEVDIFGMTLPVTKWSVIVKKASEIASAIQKAFAVATTGRKGPVLVDIPSDVLEQKADYVKLSPLPLPAPKEIKEDEIARAVELINGANRPLIYVGGGVREAQAEKELSAFALQLCAPVCVSYMGIGSFDPDDASYIGVLSNENEVTAQALKECDLLVTLGARFNSRFKAFNLVKKRKIPLLQIDADKSEIDKNVLTTASVTGDVKRVLSILTKRINPVYNDDWVFRDFPPYEEEHRAVDIIKALSDKLKDSATVTTDVGLHQVWTALNFKFRSPEKFLTSGGLGAMGFGMGAAIGAHFATNSKVLVITGDGSFNMNFNELSTAVKHRIPMVVCVMNNNSLGMIRKQQLARGSKHTLASSLYLSTDYVRLAEAMGAKGVRIEPTDDINEKLDEALNCNTPVVIDCIVSINEGI